MERKVKDKIKISCKVLVRNKDGKNETKNLISEEAIIEKIDRDDYYVRTKYGTHIITESKIVE